MTHIAGLLYFMLGLFAGLVLEGWIEEHHHRINQYG